MCMITVRSIKFLFNDHYLAYSLSGALTYLNGATLLHNLRVRYHKDHIYVSHTVCTCRRIILNLCNYTVLDQ